MLIIGSYALEHYDSNFSRVKPDIDYISTYIEYTEQVSFFKKNGLINQYYPCGQDTMVIKLKPNNEYPLIREYNIAYEGTSNKLILDHCGNQEYAPLEILYLLKMSHRFKKNSPYFLKTMKDIKHIRSLLGEEYEFSQDLQDILKVRTKETYTYSHPSLMQNKDNFFVKDESFYVYDHDDIHKAVTTLDKPAYLYFKPEDSEVMVSKAMWDECSHDVKLRAGLEESFVLALERSLIPNPGVLTPKQAFDKALEKVCTSITSGWFRKFCWEHYEEIQELYDESYVEKFNKAVLAGQVKEFKRDYK